ncbi:unnamed protein product, partial [Musa acuminata var. zebrina]
EELTGLERHLQIWMEHLRTMKTCRSIIMQEGILKATNKFLRGKIVEQNGFLDAATVTAQKNGHFDVASLTAADIPNPLTMQNQFNKCFPF